MTQHQLKTKQPFYIKNFKILITLLIFFIVIPGYFFVVKPGYAEYQTSKGLFEQSKQELDQKKQQLIDYAKALSEYEKIGQSEEEKIGLILPSKLDKANLYVNLESLVKSLDLTLGSIDIQAIKKKEVKKRPGQPVKESKQQLRDVFKIKDELALVQIDLGLQDVSYSKLKKLLLLLEENLRLLDVQNLIFDPAEGSLSLSIQAYYLK